MTDVYLNNKLVGTIENAQEFVQQVVSERRRGAVDTNANISYSSDFDEVHIENSRGRARRPLIVVKEGKTLLTEKHLQQLQKNEISWSDLVKQGVIEYLDALEEENAYVAFFEKDLTKEHTH